MKKLSIAFGEVKKTSIEKKSLIVYLVDGSGSIAPDNFDYTDSNKTSHRGPLKEGLLSIVNIFPKSTQCVVQFSKHPQKECEPSEDINVVMGSIIKMKQISTLTYTNTAINFVQTIFSQYSTYSKSLFIISDGMPSIPEENPQKSLDILKSMGVRVYVFGVGDTQILPIETLSAWSTDGSAWNISNFLDFQREMEQLKEMEDDEAASQDQKIIIDVYPLSTSVRVGQPIPLKLEIRPVDSKDTIPGGTIIVFDTKDPYFEPLRVTVTEVATFTKPCEAMVTLIPHAGVKESDFKGQIGYKYTLKYVLPNSKRQINLNQGGKIYLPTGLMRGDFETPYPINVLLFGQRGNGKSATTNCLLTNLSLEEKPISVVRVRQSDVESHTTTYFQKLWFGDLLAQTLTAREDPVLAQKKREFDSEYDKVKKIRDDRYLNMENTDEQDKQIALIKEKLIRVNTVMQDKEIEFKQKSAEICKKVKLHLFDPWGTAKDTYVGTTLPMVLKGRLQPGADMGHVDQFTLPYSNAANMIHVVIFVLPLTMISIGAKVEELTGMMKECAKTENGAYDPILVVTHIDDYESEEDRKPFKDKILNKFPNCTILFHQNYTKQRERVLEIDLSARIILNAILEKYNSWKAMHREYYDGVEWSLETVTSVNPLYCHNDKCNSVAQTSKLCMICGGDTKPFRKQEVVTPRRDSVRQQSNPAPILSPRGAGGVGVGGGGREGPTGPELICEKCEKPGTGRFCNDDGGAMIPKPTPSEMVCEKCGKPGTGKFCNEDGGAMILKQSEMVCEKCGDPGTGKFCSKDGGKLVIKSKEPTCPVCKKPGPLGKFCPDDGKKYE